MKKVKRIGVLTGGGDCPGLNAVIRAVVKSARFKYNCEVIGIEDGYEGLIKQGRTRALTQESVRGIIIKGGTILGTSNRANPFAYKVSKNGASEIKDCSTRVIKRIKALELDALIAIGGDGTLVIANRLCEMGQPIVGVPKTIDNDLSATEVTFGFDTAINTATDAIDKLHTTAESHHRVIVVELMGRNAGWIATVAGIAGGADVILIPEIPFHVKPISDKILNRSKLNRPFSIVVVAEGAAPAGGEPVYQEKDGPGGFPRFGGIGHTVGKRLGECSNLEVRVTVLGHLQRGGCPSPFDRVLATRFGVAAVDLAAKRDFGKMVSLQCGVIKAVPLKNAIHCLKTVDPQGELVQTARSLGIVFGDEYR